MHGTEDGEAGTAGEETGMDSDPRPLPLEKYQLPDSGPTPTGELLMDHGDLTLLGMAEAGKPHLGIFHLMEEAGKQLGEHQ